MSEWYKSDEINISIQIFVRGPRLWPKNSDIIGIYKVADKIECIGLITSLLDRERNPLINGKCYRQRHRWIERRIQGESNCDLLKTKANFVP